MQIASEQFITSVEAQKQPSCWYRAATVKERLIAWSGTEGSPGLNEGSRSEEAGKALQRWKAQTPFSKGSFFTERLAMDNITEQVLLALLEEPLEFLEQRLGSPTAPDWITELVDALQTSPTLPSQEREALFANAAILQPWYPLLHHSLEHVLAGIEALACEYDALPFDPRTILPLLLPNLFQQLQGKVGRTMALELNIARLRGNLQGETPEERFQSYLHLLNQPEGLSPLLEEYVVLARQVLVSSQLWAACSLEFLQRLCADWPELLSVFSPEQEPGVLTEVAGGAGDTHRGGHSVMVLTFGSGWRVLYKPKSLTIDLHFQEVLAWLNIRGSHPPFRLLRLIDKKSYGWSEFVAASGCASEAEVERFYQRQGGYLALLYALDATDFHHENVIAAGEHPLLIDLEALLHPHPSTAQAKRSLAQEHLEHSVLRTALLPTRLFMNAEGEGVDISGLGQIEGQLSPRALPLWEGIGTDEMKLIRKRVEMRGGHNLPKLHGQDVRSLDYFDHLVTGFTSIYQLLMSHREELRATILPLFASDEIRFVARGTAFYTLLLTESFHPNMLRDSLKRERFFDRLWMDVEHQPSLARLIPAERADLLQGDIPLFTTRPASRDLWTSRGECLPAFFAESSLELVHRRLQLLSEEDLQRQIWLMRASFTTLVDQTLPSANSALGARQVDASLASTVAEREQLLAEARSLGDRLCSSALQKEGYADWIGLMWLNERDWQITPAGLDTAGGLPGILLFLGYLGQITGESRYALLARAGLNTLQTYIQDQALLERMGIGAFTGLGSCLFALSHLAVLWNDSSVLQVAKDLLNCLPEKIEKDEMFDLADGVAGCLAGLLTLYEVAPSAQVLALAMRCGEHLVAHTQPMLEGLGWKAKHQDGPLAGFAHGVAGIAWSLLRLAAVSGQARFHEVALAALVYERSLYSPEQHNWPDLRKRTNSRIARGDEAEFTQTEKPHYGMSWNHGAPGIALGRIASLPYLDDAVIRAEIEIALETTIAKGFGYAHEQLGTNHSLIAGDCGNLEVVLLAAQTFQTSQWYAALHYLTEQLLESVQQHGWVTGVPLQVETPGLLFGLAGIGYQCLRLAEPEQVPSILALTPPFATTNVSRSYRKGPK